MDFIDLSARHPQAPQSKKQTRAAHRMDNEFPYAYVQKYINAHIAKFVQKQSDTPNGLYLNLGPGIDPFLTEPARAHVAVIDFVEEHFSCHSYLDTAILANLNDVPFVSLDPESDTLYEDLKFRREELGKLLQKPTELDRFIDFMDAHELVAVQASHVLSYVNDRARFVIASLLASQLTHTGKMYVVERSPVIVGETECFMGSIGVMKDMKFVERRLGIASDWKYFGPVGKRKDIEPSYKKGQIGHEHQMEEFVRKGKAALQYVTAEDPSETSNTPIELDNEKWLMRMFTEVCAILSQKKGNTQNARGKKKKTNGKKRTAKKLPKRRGQR